MLRSLIVMFVLLGSPLATWAQDLNSFQVGAMGIFQGSGNSGSVLLRYDPSYSLSDEVKIGASLDWSYHSFDNETRFSTFSALINASYKFNEAWSAQGSIGAQNWACDGCETKFAVGAMVKRAVSFEAAAFIQDVWVQYLQVSQDPSANEALIGVSLKL